MTLSVAEVAAKWPSRIQECPRWFLEMGLYTQWQSDWLNWWLMIFDDWCCWFHWGVPSIQRWNFLQNFLQDCTEHVRNFKNLLTTANMYKDKPGKGRPGRKYVACMDKARQIETTENHANISKHSIQNLLVKATCLDVQKPSTSRHLHIVVFDFPCRPMESALVDLPATKSNDFRVTAKWMTRDRTRTHTQTQGHNRPLSDDGTRFEIQSCAFLQWNDLCKPSPKHLPFNFSGSTDLKRPW